jgi:hypothetical protein
VKAEVRVFFSSRVLADAGAEIRLRIAHGAPERRLVHLSVYQKMNLFGQDAGYFADDASSQKVYQHVSFRFGGGAIRFRMRLGTFWVICSKRISER